MLKKRLLVLALALMSVMPLMADIELSTSIEDLYYRGACEKAGSITMTVSENDFRGVTTAEPVYIRVTLDHQATLCQTLVNQASSNAGINDPIFLAMEVDTDSAAISLAAPAETVSIVRWVAGESAIWLRVQADSSFWLDVNGGATSPTIGLEVSWTFGISARSSYYALEPVAAQHKNLPFNSKDGSVGLNPSIADFEESASTLICCNLTASNLTADGTSNSLLNFDPIAYDHEAETATVGVYRASNDTGINFTNDFTIARGKLRQCDVTIVGKAGYATTSLCIPAAGTNQNVNGFVYASNSITFNIKCKNTGDYIQTDLVSGAYWRFSSATNTKYGFAADNDNVSFAAGYDSEVTLSSAFTSHSRTLYHTADLIYDADTAVTLTNRNITVDATVCMYYSDGATPIDLAWSIVLVNHDGALDDDANEDTDIDSDGDSEFNNDDQYRRCPPSQFQIASGTWAFGAFIECTGVPSCLFFPYLPKMQDTDFWAGVAIVNQGGVDFAAGDVAASIYTEDGSHYEAAFPALPTQANMTFLLNNGASGPAFYGAAGSANAGQVIVPAAEGTVSQAFGSSRMSMFVCGFFDAEFVEELYNGDLDGYLLIGNGTDINGSYLPRNYDNEIPGQDADLPLNRWKSAASSKVLSNEMSADQKATYGK